MRSEAFAIYHTWPDLRNAEYEVLQRILGAADRIGKRAVVIDNGGTVIWAHPTLKIRKGSLLLADDVEFAISLHFESPRVCDVYTYYALWQPVEFYADFGYQASIDKFSTHNDLLSCHSDIADNHALNIFSGMDRSVPVPLPSLFHTLPEPFLTPKISSQSSLFYIGINWERIGRPKGRFHDVLTKLDSRELIKIYGPELIQGVAPWEGFKTYSGELPFDGESILGAINDCGICLALSSKAHQNSGIMSNRLFEGLAGGAAVIANPNALIDKYFGDIVYVVDDGRGEAFLEQQIVSCLRDIRNDPEAAKARVLKGQEILRTLCSLEGSLQTLFDQTALRKQHFYRDFPRNSSITVVLIVPGGTVSEVEAKVAEISAQMLCAIDLHLIFSPEMMAKCTLAPCGSIKSVTPYSFEFDMVPAEFDGREEAPIAIGGLIGEILAGVETPYFAIMRQTDMIMRDHFASLAKAIEGEQGASCAVSGSLLRARDLSGREQRRLYEMRVSQAEKLLVADGNLESGRALFRTSLFKTDYLPLMNLLDGEEHHLFLLAALIEGTLAQSNFASHLHNEAATLSIRSPALSSDLQRQFIRDYFNGDTRWRSKVGQSSSGLTLTSTTDPRSPGRWSTLHSHNHGSRLLELDRTYSVRKGEVGLIYLVSGFSFPEDNAVWLVGDRGVIEFSLPRHAASHIEDYRVVLGVCGRRSNDTGRMQHCTILVNNLAVAYQAIPDFFTNISVKIPLNIMRGTSNFRIEIVPDHLEIVYDSTGNVIDGRTLSVLINSIAVARDASEGVFILPINQTHLVVEGEAIIRALTAGFYAPERNVTWMCGLLGELEVRVRETLQNPVLSIKLQGREANQLGTAQEVFISINGREVQKINLASEARKYQIPIAADDLTDILRISIRGAHAEPVLDGSGNIVDPRLLGVALFEVGIFEQRELEADRMTVGPAVKTLYSRFHKIIKGK